MFNLAYLTTVAKKFSVTASPHPLTIEGVSFNIQALEYIKMLI